MPTLNWIGKDAVINHHLDVPFKTLEKKYTEGGDSSENKIIHGDNLEALKALLPEYEGKVKCVYIDPPYNTGNEKWVYNDNVNSPRIRKWLGEVVGKEMEDLTRHDKWLCMMYPRLKLLHRLLADDGVIFISIDDNEQANLKLICDEIFEKRNFACSIPWQSRQSLQNDTDISVNHEFILVYAKKRRQKDRRLKENNSEEWFNIKEFAFYPIKVDEEKFSNPDNDPRGPWKADPFDAPNIRENLTYPIINPSTGEQFLPPNGRHWRMSQEKFQLALAENRIIFGKNGKGKPQLKVFFTEKESWGSVPNTWFSGDEYGTATKGTKIIQAIFPEFSKSAFDTPKPTMLIEHLLELSTISGDIILDSYAGSGTTAHAVLNLNKKDGGNRKFILVEMEDYAEEITAERVRRVINGYPYKGKVEEEIYSKKLTTKNILGAETILQEAEAVSEERQSEFTKISKPKIQDNCIKVIGTKEFDKMMEGLGGSFSFYELGEPIMVDGNLNTNLDTQTIREFIWYTETHTAYVSQQCVHPYLLGRYDDTDYYFYYEPDKETTLDRNFLATITQKAERYLIYADNCILPQEIMAKYNIIFKKIPRDIKTF